MSREPTPCGASSPPIDFVIIGAMKCGTTSLHHYLAHHPAIAMAPGKEVNFFFGTEPDGPGNHWRGVDWYRRQMPRGGAIRGEASPGYTSPDHPGVAERIARLAPEARLVYLVRDPVERALSQYRHHRRDGTERREPAEALLDPDAHYLRRSRYAARLEPFLERFAPRRIAVVDHQHLLHRTRSTVAGLCEFLGVEPPTPSAVLDRRLNRSHERAPRLTDDVARAFRDAVADDARTFAALRRELHAIHPAEAPALG